MTIEHSTAAAELALTEEVVAAFDATPDDRLRDIVTSLVRHLHAFVRDVKPSLAEWNSAIEFLTAVGQKCDNVRQEFVLFSDVLGVSMLVENVNNLTAQGATDSTVLGPFHMTVSPVRELGDTIDLIGRDEELLVTGWVRGTDGEPVPHAEVDVWQCDPNGFYDVQQPDVQPPGNGRGLFRAGADGRFWFRTVKPSHYPIPTDGPVGVLLKATARHPFRPAHIHFIVAAPGYRTLTTHIFMPGSRYLESDAVFAVKHSLIGEICSTDPAEAAKFGVPAGTRLMNVDLILAPPES